MNIQVDTRLATDGLLQKTQENLPRAVSLLSQIREGQCTGAEWCGWYNYPQREGRTVVEEALQARDDVPVPYDTVVVVGIGGSYLGTRAVEEALSHRFPWVVQERGRKNIVYAGQDLSEKGLVELIELLEQRLPIVVVVSKSGTTTEPGIAFRVLRAYLEKRYGARSAERIIAITDSSKGALRQLADNQGYRSFAIPDNVGGRFSVLTPVGIVPLALAGFDVKGLMEGAAETFVALDADLSQDNPAVRYAAMRRAAFDLGKTVEVMSCNEPKLTMLCEWWKQLFGESEGKQERGMFPASAIFSTDLHSLGQYLQEGGRHVIETFLNVKPASLSHGVEQILAVPKTGSNLDGLAYLEGKRISEIDQVAMMGTKLAHHDGGLSCTEIAISGLDAFQIGSLFAFFETTCAISGLLLDVNPFDQPGVEAYKKNLFALLGKPGFEELGKQLRSRQ